MRKLLKILLLTAVLLLTISGCRSTAPRKILVEANAYTFSDGESVSIWKFPNDNKQIFTLRNGTELLVTNIVGPGSHIAGDVILFEELEKNVQNSISAFYNQQRVMFDVDQYLEQAYAEYTKMENQALFRCYYLTQESFISGIDDKSVYCTTSGLLPVNGESYKSYSITQSFDRITGIPLSK